MRNRHYFWAMLLLVQATVPRLYAQPHGEATLSLNSVILAGELADGNSSPGFGAGFLAMLSVPRTPFQVGVEGSITRFGEDRRVETFGLAAPEIKVDVLTSRSAYNVHLVGRVQSPVGSIRPYVEGLAGYRFQHMTTHIENDGYDTGQAISSTTFEDDRDLSYGFGTGLSVRIYRGMLGYPPRQSSVSLTAGVRYLFGGTTSYLKEGSVRPGTTCQVSYSLEPRNLDALVPQVGVGMTF